MNLWHVELSDLFDSSYKKLSFQMQGSVDEAISHLAASENPADMGIPKKGRFKGYSDSHKSMYSTYPRFRT